MSANEAGEGQSYSDKLAEAPAGMVVKCFNAFPMDLSLVGAPQSQGGEKPFVHLDRHLGAGWSSVYASSRSHVIVKFAKVPKKDKAELERQLRNEKAAYDKLALLIRWVVPHCYGEYLWYGGRSLVLSEEGPSLSALGMEFVSLGLVERIVLFGQLYLIHCLGVCHWDFEPRNVLRKGWCRLTIIDFGISDVNHTCPGWRECPELRCACEQLRLDRLATRHKSGLLRKVRLVTNIGCGSFLFYFLFVSIIRLAVPERWVCLRTGESGRC
ncbi:hypothetical protein BJV78DRAFT_84068 [Lactifluus subvellereus]|nr:hypothetical protein BJV78DRAFT_84068 [Lactifluus subvellereus]